jgi:hypothetical protein
MQKQRHLVSFIQMFTSLAMHAQITVFNTLRQPGHAQSEL